MRLFLQKIGLHCSSFYRLPTELISLTKHVICKSLRTPSVPLVFSFRICVTKFGNEIAAGAIKGLVVRQPVFGVSEKVRFKPACSATETSSIYATSLVASVDMILSNKQITQALIRLRGCAGWSAPLLFANLRRQVLSRRGPYYILLTST